MQELQRIALLSFQIVKDNNTLKKINLKVSKFSKYSRAIVKNLSPA